MAEVGQETVDFAALVGRAAEESYVSLKDLVEKSRSSETFSDSEKKIMILKYIVKTQQRMLRLNVLAKWCQQVPLIQYSQQLASTLSSHDTCFTQAADSMFFMHEGLQQARAPIYDVPSAIEVLLTGTYQRLPKCIEDVGTQGTLNKDQKGPALKKLNMLVRSKLLQVSLPKEITEVNISDGVALLHVDGEFKVLVTLGYRGDLSMWRILHLELLVGEKSGPVKVEESRRHALGDDLERRMAASENPFTILYSILHELCVALIMDTVIRQVQALLIGRWKDAIQFELISDGNVGQAGSAGPAHNTQDGEADSAGLRTPGLKVIYWLDLDKNSGPSDSGLCPFLKIEPGSDLQIKCSHSTFDIGPVTEKKTDFCLDKSCIDVEMLLLRAIGSNRYTRLLEIYKELEKNIQVNRTPGDVQLHFRLDENETDDSKEDTMFDLLNNDGKEVLRCEEALSQGSMTAARAFIRLRSESILHLFARIGRFLGLEVFEQGFNALKLPKNISDGSSSLIMGFPECGSSYFLLMQLDKDFNPSLKLVEAQLVTTGKNELSKVIRVKNIDISQMYTSEDELNLTLDSQNMLSISNDINVAGISGHGLLSDSVSMHRSNIPVNFSSIVDEVFELEKGSNTQVSSSNFGLSSTSNFGSSNMNLHNIKPATSSNSLTANLGRSQAMNKMVVSRSDQDLTALRSPHSGGFSSYGHNLSGAVSNSMVASPSSTMPDSGVFENSNQESVSQHDRPP